MRLLLGAALALLLGLFLGGLGPRAELRRVKTELSEARAAADRARGPAALPMALGMGSLFAARDRAAAAPLVGRRPGGQATAPATAEQPAAERDDDDDDGRRDAGADGGRRRQRLRDFGDPQAFEAIKTAADLRASQFMDAFLEQARLNADEKARLDDAIKQMNVEFAAEADKIAALVDARGDQLAPRDMADIGVQMLQVYQRADDKLRQVLTSDQLAAARKTEFDLLTQVDVGSFRKLGEVADRVGRLPGTRR